MPLDISAPPSRFMEQYAKQYNAGAFAAPTAKEIAANPGRILDYGPAAGQRAVVARQRLTRNSSRRDFTGSSFTLPQGALVATHVAHTPGYLPPMGAYDYVMAYAEDEMLSAVLPGTGRVVTASRVTAAAEVINCWGPPGSPSRAYAPYDRATVTDMGIGISMFRQSQITDELETVSGWDDDFPYYSDGSWSSVSLRGFWPDDPGRGVKPSEMPQRWKAEHPEDLVRVCGWTTLAHRLPALRRLVEDLPWIGRTERVRLLRMGAGGKLGRHTDITDRFGGTRDGQITRFHIPLVTDPGAKLITWDIDGVRREQHLERWGCYYLDARKPHAVVNDSAIDRIHLVVDAVTDHTVRAAITNAHLLADQVSA